MYTRTALGLFILIIISIIISETDCSFVAILTFPLQLYTRARLPVGINYFFIGIGIESAYIEENIIHLEVYSFSLLSYLAWVYTLYISTDAASVQTKESNINACGNHSMFFTSVLENRAAAV